MNLDKTFCTGTRCPVADTCEISMATLTRWIDRDLKNRINEHFRVSVAEFSPPEGGSCERYEKAGDGE